MANLAPLLTLLALLAALGRHYAAAAEFEVGGDDGWVVPPTSRAAMYNEWASKNRFLVGDTVHFKYKKDSVMEVTEEDYNMCRSSHPIFFSNNGETELLLDRPGLFYFISGVAGHCEHGQRMIVKVIGGGAPPPAPSAPSPPSEPPSPPPPHPSGGAATNGLAGAIAVAAMLFPAIVHGV